MIDTERIRKLHAQGIAIRAISRDMGVSEPSVRRHLRQDVRVPQWEEYSESIEALYIRGLKDREIARELNIGHGIVQRWRKEKHLESNYSESNRSEQKEALLELHLQGISLTQAADRLGVPRGTAYRWHSKQKEQERDDVVEIPIERRVLLDFPPLTRRQLDEINQRLIDAKMRHTGEN